MFPYVHSTIFIVLMYMFLLPYHTDIRIPCCLKVLRFIVSINFCPQLPIVHRLTNLRYWSKNRDIVDETMQLFNSLSIGYTCVRKMSKLDAVKFMLANHNVRLSFILFEYLVTNHVTT